MAAHRLQKKSQLQNQNSTQRKRSDGFAIVTLLFLTSVFLTGLAVVAGTALLFREEALKKRACVANHFTAMNQTAKLMKRLMALNPKALALRNNETRIQIALAAAVAAGQAELIATLRSRLVKVRAARLALATEQEFIKGEIQVILYRSKLSIQRTFRKWHGQTSTPTLVLRPDAQDTAPQYFPGPQFSERLTLHTTYSLDVLSTLNRLKGLLKIRQEVPEKINRSCGATVREYGKQFRPNLVSATKVGFTP